MQKKILLYNLNWKVLKFFYENDKSGVNTELARVYTHLSIGLGNNVMHVKEALKRKEGLLLMLGSF